MKKVFSNAFIKIFLSLSLALTSLTSVYLIGDKISSDRTVQQLQQEYYSLLNEKSLLDTRVVNLVSQNTSLSSNFSKVNYELNNLTQLNSNLTNTIKKLELENTELVESITSLTEEIETLNERIKTLSLRPIFSGGGGGGGSAVAPSLPSISNTPVQDPALLAEIETLKASLNTANAQNILLKTQLDQLNELVVSLNSGITGKNADIVVLNNTIDTLTAEKNKLQADLDLLNSDRDLSDLLEQKTNEILLLEAQKAKLESDLALLTINYNNLLDNKEEYKLLSESLTADISKLDDEIDGYKATIIELNSDIADYQLQVSNLNTTITNYANQVNSLEATLLLKNTEINNLTLSIDGYLSDIAELNEDKNNLLDQLEYYINETGPALDFDTLNQVSQLAVKANVRIEVGGDTGSGVVYKKIFNEQVYNSGGSDYFDYYILTNYHVVQRNILNNNSILIRNYANFTKPGTLLAYQFHTTETSDNDVDLAVIKVSASMNFFYVLELATSDYVFEQQTVISIGAPRSQMNTVTVGKVIDNTSALFLSTTLYKFKVFSNAIRHSALIDKGNSGGALIDLNMKIVGINFAGNPQTNTFPYQSVEGYALSIQKINIFLEENNLK
jgi:S1-C subfamily serine protease/cell division protein FtsB